MMFTFIYICYCWIDSLHQNSHRNTKNRDKQLKTKINKMLCVCTSVRRKRNHFSSFSILICVCMCVIIVEKCMESLHRIFIVLLRNSFPDKSSFITTITIQKRKSPWKESKRCFLHRTKEMGEKRYWSSCCYCLCIFFSGYFIYGGKRTSINRHDA